MGHNITLVRNDSQVKDCFPVVGEGTYQCNELLEPLKTQSALYITHNLAPIIYKAFEKLGLEVESFGAWLHGRTCLEVLPTLILLRKEIEDNPTLYLPMQPKNGWGSQKDLIEKLRSLCLVCCEYPDAIIDDSY
jgi:hypothetical protein